MTNATPPSTRIKLGAGVLAWRNAVFAIFVLNGVELASWVSRIPGVRDDLTLSDADIADIMDYERSSWGNHGQPVTPAQVAAERAKVK